MKLLRSEAEPPTLVTAQGVSWGPGFTSLLSRFEEVVAEDLQLRPSPAAYLLFALQRTLAGPSQMRRAILSARPEWAAQPAILC